MVHLSMYDYATLSDAFEGITHSVCTLEFADHRPLYDWCLAALDMKAYPRPVEYLPRQIEFARLNLKYTVMSKRKLRELVEKGYVNGWDDPRMPTISGLRRRGYTPEALRDFCNRIGVAKRDSMVDIALLEHCVREDLNLHAARVMAVLRPLKVIIDNYPKIVGMAGCETIGESGWITKIPFSRRYISSRKIYGRPPKKFFRCAGGIRLKSAYIIKCEEVVKDSAQRNY
jgi:glutaminyl-tRNA synthetase